MNDMTGGPGRGRPGAITAPARLVVRRPEPGWIAGFVGKGIMAIAGLAAGVAALAVLAGITAALWWAGDAPVPVVVLVYGCAVLAGAGFAVGRGSRVEPRCRPPRGPDLITWPRETGRIRTGVVWQEESWDDEAWEGEGSS